MRSLFMFAGQNSLSFQSRSIKAAAAGAVFSVLLIIYIIPPMDLPVSGCAFRSITGHSCLTCGMTRSLHAVSNGRFAESFKFHLFGPAVFIGLLVCSIIWTFQALTGKVLDTRISKSRMTGTAVLIALIWTGYWCIRLITEIIA